MIGMKNFLAAASAVALSASTTVAGVATVNLLTISAAQAATVSRIDVRGNKRVDASVIIGYVGIKPGKPFSNADIDEAVKRLFATGLFSDVRINQVGGTLVVEVDEYSVVNQVLFQGNKKIKDADLARQVQTQPRGVYSPSTIEADLETIREAYQRVGRSDAVVKYQVIDLGENRVNVVFEINEGGRTKIGSISFVGNNAYSDRRLSEVISTKKSNILSYLFRDDVYDDQRLHADEEALRRFYYNRGYADFQVISSSAQLDEATNEYSVVFTVEEGDRYTFGPITVESTVEGIDANNLKSSIESHEGDVYSAKDVEDTIVGITERVSGMGYAFAQVNPRGDRNFETRTISVTYTIDQGARTYVERIEIRGNERTRDYVIRREFDLAEGDAFNQVLVQRAKKRLEDLEFFTSVNISTAPGSEADQIILIVDVVEKSTGEFSIGGGYSTGQTSDTTAGFKVEASVTEKNFLGRGQYVKVAIGGGKKSRDYSLSFTEPYFLGHRLAVGFDIGRNTRGYTNYDSVTDSLTLRAAAPITEALTATLAYNLSQESYSYNSTCDADNDGLPDVGCSISVPIQDAISLSPWIKSSVNAGLIYSTIDNMNNPRDGIRAQLNAEVAGLGGDAKYAKFTARSAVYKTLLEEQDVVGVLIGGAGHMEALGANGMRVFDLFHSSDRMIRGFEYDGIGPYDGLSGTNTGDHLGGTTYFNASAEVQFPLPAVPQSVGIKGALFADAATLFGSPYATADGTAMAWRASVGASLLWASPFGPLRLDYAIPVIKQDGDVVQNFSFGMSTRF
jgi:outer membrane protein insertion porin family